MRHPQPVTDSPALSRHDLHDGIDKLSDTPSVAQLRLRGGACALARPIRAQDAAGLARAYRRLSEQSRWWRFLSLGAAALHPAELRRLTAVDHRDHEALVAVDPGSGEIVGCARYARLPGRYGDAELAVEVIDEWQGRGVGRGLVEMLGTRAQSNGVRRFVAIVSADNEPVHRALRHAGAIGSRWGSEVEYPLDLDLLSRRSSIGPTRAVRSRPA